MDRGSIIAIARLILARGVVDQGLDITTIEDTSSVCATTFTDLLFFTIEARAVLLYVRQANMSLATVCGFLMLALARWDHHRPHDRM